MAELNSPGEEDWHSRARAMRHSDGVCASARACSLSIIIVAPRRRGCSDNGSARGADGGASQSWAGHAAGGKGTDASAAETANQCAARGALSGRVAAAE
jgi:hypothetical protein